MSEIFRLNINDDQMEVRLLEAFDFPVYIYERKLSDYVLGFLELHWHNEVQFAYVTQGACKFLINQQPIDLDEGMGIFVNSGCLHMAKPMMPNVSLVHVIFDPNILSGYIGSAINLKYVAPLIHNLKYPFAVLRKDVPWQQLILRQLQRIVRLHNNESTFADLEMYVLLLGLWKNLIKSIAPIEHAANYNSYVRLKQIVSYLNTHYRERISLAQIAADVHLSRHECCKYFKRHMQCTIFEYLNAYRLSQSAKALSSEHDMSIGDIALEYGFGSASAFAEKFRAKTGVTPSLYRKMHANPDQDDGSV